MSRQTSQADLFRWHTQALEDVDLHLELTIEQDPQCGWFQRRLVKGGPYVPAKIWMVQPVDENGDLVADETLQADVNGAWADPDDAWQWLCGNPISEARFNYLTATLQWSADHAPDEPMANPRQAVDWNNVPTPTF